MLNLPKYGVIGHRGLLGRAICEAARSAGDDVFALDGYRLNPHLSATVARYTGRVLFNCAGHNGGIGFTQQHQFDIFLGNTIPAYSLICAALEENESRPESDKLSVVMPVASCAYPDYDYLYPDQRPGTGICIEEEFIPTETAPNASISPHGYAKRNVQLVCKYANEQHGIRAVTFCPPTLLGPGDRYEPDRSKIMAAMIRRFVEAVESGANIVECWGTGQPMRQFLYVKDAARMALLVAESYQDCTKPLNLPGVELSVQETAEMVARIAGYRGRIVWDRSKPDGQYRKRLDSSRFEEMFRGQYSLTPIEDAVEETVKAYRNHLENVRMGHV